MKYKDTDKFEEEDDSEEEVLSIFCFKSTLNLKALENMEISEEKLNNLLIGVKCDIQYNFENQNEGNNFRLVKFTMT